MVKVFSFLFISFIISSCLGVTVTVIMIVTVTILHETMARDLLDVLVRVSCR
jgi:hypothetical protein